MNTTHTINEKYERLMVNTYGNSNGLATGANPKKNVKSPIQPSIINA